MKTFIPTRWLICLSLGFTVLGASAAEVPDLATRINQVRVFNLPIMWIGQKPNEADTQALWDAIETARTQGREAGVKAMENFLTSRPRSDWTPGIRAQLGKHYRDEGRYTLALQHWELAWEATKHHKEGSGKQIADFTFAHWIKLLASLGRQEQLTELFTEARRRSFSGPIKQMINSTSEGFTVMKTAPDVSYRCGTYALDNVARQLNPSAFTSRALMHIASPPKGFSLAKLTELSSMLKLDLIPVRRTSGTNLPVPAVVHWKQNHYAAITEMRNGKYLVKDPTFRENKWMTAATINEEASGYFMVAKGQMPEGFTSVTPSESALVFGKGYPNAINNNASTPCNDPCPPGCPPGSNGSGKGGGGANGPGSSCSSCSGTPPSMPSRRNFIGSSSPSGMPVWRVDEPYIILWLEDEPLGYQPVRGERVSLSLHYKQRDEELQDFATNFFSFGPMWNPTWRSYLFGGGDYWTQRTPGGGLRDYSTDIQSENYYNYFNFGRLETAMSGDDMTNAMITYSDGSRIKYSLVLNGLIEGQIAFMTERITPDNQTNRFIYDDSYTNNRVLLKYVVDADGRTNYVRYTDVTFTNQVSEVEDAFGHTATFLYDATGLLTNITDVAGIASGFQYDGDNAGWITNLITPYGTTQFELSPGADIGSTAPIITRWVKVSEPAGAKHLFGYRDNSEKLDDDTTPFLPGGYLGSMTPTNTPLLTMDNTNMFARNTFYWGPKQYDSLSTTDVTLFTTNDYNKARLRHWLHAPGLGAVGQILSLERDPSADGVNVGQFTWYDYYGKPGVIGEDVLWFWEGTNSQPGAIVRMLPDGTTWYQHIQYDLAGHATNIIETYSPGTNSALVLTRTNMFVYETNNLIKHIDPAGHMVVSNLYNVNNQVIVSYNALNDMTTYAYDSAGRLTNIVQPSGLRTAYQYDGSGYLEKTIDVEITRTNTFTYTNGLIRTHTDERGLVITNYWDALQRLTGTSCPEGTTSNKYHLLSASFYPNSTGSTNILDRTAAKDRLGNWTYFRYDGQRRLTRITNALGYVSSNLYCDCGSLEKTIDALANTNSYGYDLKGRRTSVTQPGGVITYFTYDLLDRLIKTEDSAGNVVTNTYNHQGLLIAVSNAFGQVVKQTYDIEDRVTNIVNASGVTTTNSYDDLGRILVRAVPAASATESFLYNTNGMVAYTDALSKITRYQYDAAGRKITETNAITNVVSFTYNAAGDLLTLTDGNTNVTTWGYDVHGRVTSKTNAANTEIFRYTYDANGRLTNRWTPSKLDTGYGYDLVGNLTVINYTTSPDITMQYDALNRLTNMVDAVGTNKYAYTNLYLLSEDGPWADDTVSYTYNNRGLRSGFSLAQPSGSWTNGYLYDAARRLTNVTSGAGAFSYEYTGAGGLVKKLLLPNTGYITNAYDSAARLTDTSLKNSSHSNLNSHAYQLNNGNQRTKQTRTDGSYVDYSYDDIGQVKTAIGKESGGTTNRFNERFGYAYDAAGNLLYRTNDTLIHTFSGNALNQISNITRNGTMTVAGSTAIPVTNVTVNTSNSILYADLTFASTNHTLADGTNVFTAIAWDSSGQTDTNTISVWLPATNTFAFDANGNLTNDGKKSLEYDDENQLIRVTVTNAWKSEFVYDGKLRRRVRTEFVWSGAAWVTNEVVRYVYDGNLAIQERDVSNAPVRTVTRGRDLSGSMQGAGGIGGMLSLTVHGAGNTNAYYHADGNGNVTALVGTNQTLVAKYLYDPYGNMLAMSGDLADANSYRFSSKENHANSGMYYYLYRYYVPESQRWLNQDPLGDRGHLSYYTDNYSNWNIRYRIAVETWGGANLYGFVRNDPLILVDKDGRIVPVLIGGGIAAGTAQAVAASFGLGLAACMATPACAQAVRDALSQLLNKAIDVCRRTPKPPLENPKYKTCYYACPLSGLIPVLCPVEYACPPEIDMSNARWAEICPYVGEAN
jgi:RHS repeat-associated protein